MVPRPASFNYVSEEEPVDVSPHQLNDLASLLKMNIQDITPGLYALLPPGWYMVRVKNEEHNNRVQLMYRSSEIDLKLHEALCKRWALTVGNWKGKALFYMEWDNVMEYSHEEAAKCTILIDSQFRDALEEELVDQTFYKPWMGTLPIDIDEYEYYENNHEVTRGVKLPHYFNINFISYFCKLYNVI